MAFSKRAIFTKPDQPTQNGAARVGAEGWSAEDVRSVLKSPRVLPGRGIDDKSLIRAVMVAGLIWLLVTIAASLAVYGIYRLVRLKIRQ